MAGLEMIFAGSVTPRSTPQGRWRSCAGLTTTPAAKSRMSVRTGRLIFVDLHSSCCYIPSRNFLVWGEADWAKLLPILQPPDTLVFGGFFQSSSRRQHN